MTKYKQQGQVSTEWVIVMLIVVVALFAPIPGQDQSLVGLVMQSIKDFHEHGSMVYSLP